MKIIVDSACDLPLSYLQEHGVDHLPLSVIMDGKEYNDQMEVHLYPEAGHLFIMNRYMGTPDALIAFGGNENTNNEAFEDSNAILFERLAEWHTP